MADSKSTANIKSIFGLKLRTFFSEVNTNAWACKLTPNS